MTFWIIYICTSHLRYITKRAVQSNNFLERWTFLCETCGFQSIRLTWWKNSYFFVELFANIPPSLPPPTLVSQTKMVGGCLILSGCWTTVYITPPGDVRTPSHSGVFPHPTQGISPNPHLAHIFRRFARVNSAFQWGGGGGVHCTAESVI